MSQRVSKIIAASAAAVVLAISAVGVATQHSTTTTKTVTVTKTVGAETVYIRNLAPKFISDATIKNAIPAWTKAMNRDFAGFWHTTPYRFVFLGRKPFPIDGHSITAVFQNRGPVKGALAYHWTERNNAPSITVYAGTGAYYGFDNSVSFTHEIQELAADSITSFLNIGYPSDYFYEQKANGDIKQFFNSGIGWFNEVSDPVEADSYTIPGANGKPVKISDFVTPAWFNDGVSSRFDFMGLCQQPFWIRPGGYAQFLDPSGWNIVENFRHNHPADQGFAFDSDGGLKLPRGTHIHFRR